MSNLPSTEWRNSWKQTATQAKKDFAGLRTSDMAGAFLEILTAYDELRQSHHEAWNEAMRLRDVLLNVKKTLRATSTRPATALLEAIDIIKQAQTKTDIKQTT